MNEVYLDVGLAPVLTSDALNIKPQFGQTAISLGHFMSLSV